MPVTNNEVEHYTKNNIMTVPLKCQLLGMSNLFIF